MERDLSILITYMECFFAKTAVCTTNIITWLDYSCIATGANSAASCVCSINNSTGVGGLYKAIINAVFIGWSCINDNMNQGLM